MITLEALEAKEMDVRMACLSLFVNELHLDPATACSYMERIDKLANFILHGKGAYEIGVNPRVGKGE